MVMLRYFITSKAKRNLLKFFFLNSAGKFYTRQVARLTGEPLNAVRRELTHLEKAGLLHSHMEGNQKYYEIVESFPCLTEWEKIILQGEPAGKGVSDTVSVASAEQEEETAVEESREAPDYTPEVVANEETREPEEPLAAAMAVVSPDVKKVSISSMSALVDYLRQQFEGINAITLAVIHGESASSEHIPKGGVELLIVGDISKDVDLSLVANIEDETGIPMLHTRMTRSDFEYRNAKGDPLIRHIWGAKKIVVKGRR